MLEIATAASLGRLVLKPTAAHWLEVAQRSLQTKIEPLTAELCLASTALPGEFHRDPADRLIVALARKLDADLVTADHKILNYPGVRAINAGQ